MRSDYRGGSVDLGDMAPEETVNSSGMRYDLRLPLVAIRGMRCLGAMRRYRPEAGCVPTRPRKRMPSTKIIWTKIDEAPALATYSLLPIVQAYARGTGIEFETRDISLVGRLIANFPERLKEKQRIPDELERLGDLAKTPEANIIK